MFGRRARKQAEQEALKRMMEEAEANRRAALKEEEESKFYYDSEIIFDDDDFTATPDVQNEPVEDVEEQTAQPTTLAALPVPESEKQEPEVQEQQVVEPVASEPAMVEEKQEEPATYAKAEEITTAEQPDDQTDGESEPEIRYVVDGPTEDDEIVKPAKLVKLPNLVDYMLSLKMSKRMKMNVATLLIGAYAKYKDIPAEREIIVGCMKKVMFALMNS